jgi:glycosyltransferase involved in cell wall biosynthesis
MRCPRLAYISFDTAPAPKGASIHIESFARALAGAFGGVELVTIASGAEASCATERWPGVLHTELPALGETLIDRVLCFRRFLVHWLRERRFDAIQFRSIFEGLPLVELRGRSRLVFEVNGLPSIELKYRYPGVEDDRELMRKLVAQERACLEAADLVVTPSGVTREYLVSARNVSAAKIRVIPNGVDVEIFCPAGNHRPEACKSQAHRPEPCATRLLYFGTLSVWQGVELGVWALAQVRSQIPATLTIIGTGSGREKDALMGLASKLGVAASLNLLQAMPQAELAEHLRASDAVLAPLTWNDRNLIQGCCPLKILESMAAGVPVIASDLGVVRELGCDGVHFLLVKPGSVDQIAQAVLRLAADRELARRIGRQARQQILQRFTWRHSGDALASAYEELGISRARIA